MRSGNALQALGRSKEGINDQICQKFGAFTVWVNPWGCLFTFLKILIFGLTVLVLGPKIDRKPWGTLGKT